MTYASVQDLLDVIPERDLVLLTDDSGPADTVDTTRLERALEAASAEIDGYIAKRVTLPLADPPRILTTLCMDLALQRLFSNVGRSDETRDKVRADAIAYLEKVGKGILSLGDEDPQNTKTISPGPAMTDGADRHLTRDTLDGY